MSTLHNSNIPESAFSDACRVVRILATAELVAHTKRRTTSAALRRAERAHRVETMVATATNRPIPLLPLELGILSRRALTATSAASIATRDVAAANKRALDWDPKPADWKVRLAEARLIIEV